MDVLFDDNNLEFFECTSDNLSLILREKEKNKKLEEFFLRAVLKC